MTTSRLSMDNIKKFHKDGFVILQQHFTHQQIRNLNLLLQRMLHDNTLGEKNIHECLQELRNDNPAKFSGLLNTFSKSASVQKVFLTESLLSILKQLGLKEPSFITYPVTHMISDELYQKSGDSPVYGFRPHQDWGSIQGSLNGVVCWFPLGDVVDNYPLQLLPGSHQTGFQQHTDRGNGFPEITIDKEVSQKFITPQMSIGDMIIFSTFLVHRTRPSVEGSCGFRGALSARFDDIENEYFRDNNYYCAYKRTVDRQLRYYPTTEQINSIINNPKRKTQ